MLDFYQLKNFFKIKCLGNLKLLTKKILYIYITTIYLFKHYLSKTTSYLYFLSKTTSYLYFLSIIYLSIIYLTIIYLSIQTSTDGATTTSTILYTPLPEHTGSMLRCVSGLESLPGSTVETAYSLKVHCKQIDRQIGGKTDRQIDGQIERQIYYIV